MKQQHNRTTLTREKKLEAKHYRILIALVVLYVVYYSFFRNKVVGHDNRYIVYIVVLPTLCALLALAAYRRHFLVDKFSTNKGSILWVFMAAFYLIQGLLFSYLSIGQSAQISWDIVNNRAAKQNDLEVIQCEIIKFKTFKRSSGIEFILNSKAEKLDTRYSAIKDYADKKPEDNFLEITIQKGLWNYYLVRDWKVKKKSNE